MADAVNEGGNGTEGKGAEGGAGGGGEGKTPPTPPEKKEGKADPPAAPAKADAAKKDESKPDPKEKKEARQLGDDDEIPEDADLLQLSKSALTKRLTRHTKKELRDRFGTDDMDKIKADLDELTTLRADREKRRRDEMTENQRLKEDAEREKARADKAEREKQEALDAQEYAGYDRDAQEILAPLVAKKHLGRAMRELKEHILTLDDKDLGKPKKVFDAWAKKFVEENPEFAKPKEEPKKVPLNTGANPNVKKEKSDPQLATKTPMPGKPNSMTRAEYAQYKRERGLA